MIVELDELIKKQPSELTDEEKTHLRENKDDLTDEEREMFKEVLNDEPPQDDGKVTVSKSVLDRKDIAAKNAKKRADEAEAEVARLKQITEGKIPPETVSEEVKRQLAITERERNIENAASKLATNDDEKKAMIEYMNMSPSTGDYSTDAEIARNFVHQRAKAKEGVSAPIIPDNVQPRQIPSGTATEGQRRLASQMGLADEDLKRFNNEIQL
jgi:hypothetical protein